MKDISFLSMRQSGRDCMVKELNPQCINFTQRFFKCLLTLSTKQKYGKKRNWHYTHGVVSSKFEMLRIS